MLDGTTAAGGYTHATLLSVTHGCVICLHSLKLGTRELSYCNACESYGDHIGFYQYVFVYRPLISLRRRRENKVSAMVLRYVVYAVRKLEDYI